MKAYKIFEFLRRDEIKARHKIEIFVSKIKGLARVQRKFAIAIAWNVVKKNSTKEITNLLKLIEKKYKKNNWQSFQKDDEFYKAKDKAYTSVNSVEKRYIFDIVTETTESAAHKAALCTSHTASYAYKFEGTINERPLVIDKNYKELVKTAIKVLEEEKIREEK